MDPKRVLIVDDEKDFVATLADRLELRGYSVTPAHDGLTALRSVAEAPPSAVILDLMMPGMNGVELLRCLTRNWPGLPVIVLTGKPSENVTGECLRLGAFRFMTKPENFEDLLANLEAAGKAAMSDKTARGNTAASAPRVLVVDNDERYREELVKLLGALGIPATGVASGEEALELTSMCSYDVIVLDSAMPGLSGLGTLKRLKQTGCQAATIVVTGQASLEDAHGFLALGACDYLLKPVSTDVLLAKIREAHARGNNQTA